MHYTTKKLDEQRAENKRLQVDNEDLQREFQREREGYLGTIRDLEKQLLLYQTMTEKMSRAVPRNCNYSNLDRIREQARYDESKDLYYLPEPTREDVQLPQMGSLPSTSNGRVIQQDYAIPARGNLQSSNGEYEDDFIVPDEYSNNNYEEVNRRYARNSEAPPAPPAEKTRNKRQEQLLTQNLVLQRAKRPVQMNENDYMNRRLNPYDAPARLSRKYNFPSDKQ